MSHIVIAGSGPVGSFIAVLCAQLGFPVTVYEKREEFSRNFNVKIDSLFFMRVHEVISQLNIRSKFFAELNDCLKQQNNTIQIKELEERFATEAKCLGVEYIIREVESFDELYYRHESSDPIILDCTGRSSKLRIDEFGPDESNIISIPLQHAMYISCKAKMYGNISLYQVMKYITTIKLTEVVVSENKDENGFSDITIPVFIDDKLARIFDKQHPDINRNPLNPFNSLTPVSDSIFLPISSIIGNLIVDGCAVDLNSVLVKKIEISCGYAKQRSRNRYICLGDSAIHLAFFRSLNLGLKHALEFFIELAMYYVPAGVQDFDEKEIIIRFIEFNPFLNPIKVYPTVARNVFLVVTKVIWYGCFSFNLSNSKTERLTLVTGVYENQIWSILKKLNTKLSRWSYSLANFEDKRDEDIRREIQSNVTKSELYDFLSLFIDINGKSFIKISELVRAAGGKYSLYKKDLNFFLKCFKARREALKTNSDANGMLINIISNLVHEGPWLSHRDLKAICANKDISSEDKLQLIMDTVFEYRQRKSKSVRLSDSCNEYVSSSFILTLIKNELMQTPVYSECHEDFTFLGFRKTKKMLNSFVHPSVPQ